VFRLPMRQRIVNSLPPCQKKRMISSLLQGKNKDLYFRTAKSRVIPGYMTQSKTDRPGFDRRMSREEINACPIERWTGPVSVVHSRDGLAAAMDRLAGQNLLGFDTETRSAHTKGESYPPALLQLAGESEVFIFQLKHLGLAEPLRRILEIGRASCRERV